MEQDKAGTKSTSSKDKMMNKLKAEKAEKIKRLGKGGRMCVAPERPRRGRGLQSRCRGKGLENNKQPGVNRASQCSNIVRQRLASCNCVRQQVRM